MFVVLVPVSSYMPLMCLHAYRWGKAELPLYNRWFCMLRSLDARAFSVQLWMLLALASNVLASPSFVQSLHNALILLVYISLVFPCMLSLFSNYSLISLNYFAILCMFSFVLCLPERCTLLVLASNIGRWPSSRPTPWLCLWPGTGPR